MNEFELFVHIINQKHTQAGIKWDKEKNIAELLINTIALIHRVIIKWIIITLYVYYNSKIKENNKSKQYKIHM